MPKSKWLHSAESSQHRSGGGEWKREAYPVYLDQTPCTYGGTRAWFRCPARGYGRRVTILYGGAIFACRHCYRLAYPSQREPSYSERRGGPTKSRRGWAGNRAFSMAPVGANPRGCTSAPTSGLPPKPRNGRGIVSRNEAAVWRRARRVVNPFRKMHCERSHRVLMTVAAIP
jgi:hypothetical protein